MLLDKPAGLPPGSIRHSPALSQQARRRSAELDRECTQPRTPNLGRGPPRLDALVFGNFEPEALGGLLNVQAATLAFFLEHLSELHLNLPSSALGSFDGSPDMIGKTIGRYRILDKIGEGGMGEVYRAQDLDLERKVALKLLPADVAADPERISRFQTEAKALAALSHPNIVTIFSVEQTEDFRFVTMELVRGRTLENLVPKGGMGFEEFLEFAIPITAGVEAAHDSGITHRDLKPANIMVTKDRLVKILDFGLAKLHIAPASEDLTQLQTVGATKTGMVLGTVAFMSPEQVRGEAVDHRTDIFSLGVIFYVMATGEMPFKQASSAGLIAALLRDVPPPVSEVDPKLPAKLGRVIARCLEKSPEKRYQSAYELRSELQAAGEEGADLARPPLRLPFPLRWAMPVALAAAVLVAAVVYWPSDGAPEQTTTATQIVDRPSLAVLGFQNLGNPTAEWISTALAEFLSTELAAGGQFRVVAGESVARMKLDLSLPTTGSLAPATLTSIRDNIGTDLVVVGSYILIEAGERAGELQLNVNVQDSRNGQTVVALQRRGTQDEIFALSATTGAGLRSELGFETLSATESAEVLAVAPTSSEATRLYSEGLTLLRRQDAIAARDLLERAVQADPQFALAHAALSRAWTDLGYDARALESAQTAAGLTEGLPRRELLLIQGRFLELSGRREEAIENYRILWGYHSDDIEHGLRLAASQIGANRGLDALETVAELRALPAPSADDPRVSLTEAAAANEIADFPRALRASQMAAQRSRETGAISLFAEARYLEGRLHNLMGNPQEAGEALAEAQRIFAEVGDSHGVARVLNIQAVLAKYAGQLDDAERKYLDAIAAHRATGSQSEIAYAVSNLAVLVQERGEFARAQTMLEETLAIGIEIQRPDIVSLARINMAFGSYRAGDLDAAQDLTVASLEYDVTVGDVNGEAWNRFNLGRIGLEHGDVETAGAEFARSLELCEQMGYEHLRAYVLVGVGQLRLAGGDLPGAREAFDESARIREQLGERNTLAESELAIATLLLEEGRLGEADGAARSAAREFRRGGREPEETQAQAVIALIALAAGDRAEGAGILNAETFDPASSEDPLVRFAGAIAKARLDVETGAAERAETEITSMIEEARSLGLVRQEVRLEVTLGEIQIAAGDRQAGSARLRSAAARARGLGFNLLASRAEAGSGA